MADLASTFADPALAKSGDSGFGAFQSQGGYDAASTFGKPPAPTQDASTQPDDGIPAPSKQRLEEQDFNGKDWLTQRAQDFFKPTEGESATNASRRARKYLEFTGRMSGLSDIGQKDAEYLWNQFVREQFADQGAEGAGQDQQDLLKQMYAPMQGTADVHAGLKDINVAQGVAGITQAILGAIRHQPGNLNMAALAAPIEEAQNRLLAKRKEAIANENLRRQGLAEQFGLKGQEKKQFLDEANQADDAFEKRLNQATDPESKLRMLQLKYEQDGKNKAQARVGAIDRLLEKPETISGDQYAKYKEEQFHLQYPGQPVSQQMHDDWVSEHERLLPVIKKGQDIKASVERTKHVDAQTASVLQNVKFKNENQPLHIQAMKDKHLISQQDLLTKKLIYRSLPDKEAADAIYRGLRNTATLNRINGQGQMLDEDGMPISKAELTATRTDIRDEGATINDQLRQTEEAVVGGGIDQGAVKALRAQMQHARATGVTKEQFIAGLNAQRQAAIINGGSGTPLPPEVGDLWDLQIAKEKNDQAKGVIDKRIVGFEQQKTKKRGQTQYSDGEQRVVNGHTYQRQGGQWHLVQ